MVVLVSKIVVIILIIKEARNEDEFCEINPCQALEVIRADLVQHFALVNDSLVDRNYELIKLERRVRSLEQPTWQILSSNDRWTSCAQGPCKCRPETKSLTCWNSKISSLPAEQAVPHDILSIDLGINLLTTLNKRSFWGLSKITEIDLFENRIDYLPESIFDKLTTLQYLRIHRNLLEELPNDIFLSLRSLRTLDLSNNNIKFLPTGVFRECPNLIVLHLSANKLTEVPPKIFNNLKLLEDLDLNGNSLSYISESPFSHLVNLKRLKLAENDLVELHTGTFHNLHSLDYLNLRKNNLVQFSNATFSNLHNLTVLELSSNKLVKVNNGSFNLRGLKELYLQQNFIYELQEDLFTEAESLEKLLLFSNNLEELKHHTFKGLLNLNSLLLNNNLLKKIHPEVFSYLPKLQKLHLDSNRFMYLPPKSLDALPLLSTIKLTKNPWHCDCNVMYLSTWISKNSNKLWDFQPTCKGPGKLGGAALKEMNFDTLCHGQWASMVHLAARIPIRPPTFRPPTSVKPSEGV